MPVCPSRGDEPGQELAICLEHQAVLEAEQASLADVMSGLPGYGSEHEDQVALADWARTLAPLHPELGLLYAIPNANAHHKLSEGLLPGIPDLCLPLARRGHHALYIELKHGKGRLERVQVACIRRLVAEGNKVVVARGWDEARRAIIEYLGIRE